MYSFIFELQYINIDDDSYVSIAQATIADPPPLVRHLTLAQRIPEHACAPAG